ncbi:MAG: GNAT family N-acetyltransferase [Candidatus Altiarchaeota archaeon]
MITQCTSDDFDAVFEIINEAAFAYKCVIPADCWHEPYMPKEELRGEIDAGVVFWGSEDNGVLVGVMGIQELKDITLIRHAYVLKEKQKRGIGSELLTHLRKKTNKPLLIGTWADASWAIKFYEKHGFKVVSHSEKERLLRKYWKIPERQVETSVVLKER